MPEVRSLYPLWPRQQEAMYLLGVGGYQNPEPVEELLYGGAAGGGKSYFMRALAVGLCLSVPKLVVPIFRRTYPELEDTHIRKIREELPPELGKYNAERHEWRFPNGSVFAFRYCERETDVYQYNSSEWDLLLVDEASQMTEPMIRYLRSRVRSTKPGWRPLIVYSTNPGNVGHHYFKKGFVDAAPPGKIFTAPEDDGGGKRVFLPALLKDNPALSADYSRKLAGIADPAMRRALMEGDWDIFAGQVFSEFRRSIHVCQPFAIPDHWMRWRGYDYGFNAPAACLWLAKDPDTKRVYVYRELYVREMRDIDQAIAIRRLSRRETIAYTAADPAVWNRNPNGTNIAQVFLDQKVPLIRANNDRLSGWQRVHEYLDPADGGPRLQMFETCPNLIRTLPSLTFDKHRVEDIDSDGDDHLADCLRYALMSSTVHKKARVLTQEFRVVA